jgi:O-acetylserine/cysteine efflux transporter
MGAASRKGDDEPPGVYAQQAPLVHRPAPHPWTVLWSGDMRLAHLVLVLLVVVIWGLAFVATRIALDDFSPAQLTTLRFLVAAAPALVLARPRVPGRALVPIGLTLFMGQFLLQFFGIASGMPPGLASIVVQTQALFTILFAALALRERPTRDEWTGTAVAFVGLAVIAATVGQDLTVTGLVFTGMSAVSWGIGNVLVKRLPPVDMLRLMVWLSVIPPLPSLALSLALEGHRALGNALAGASWLGLGAALYLGVVATVFAYAIWGSLLRRYPAATVAPFALLIPFVAAYASSLAFGERFGPLRLAGMALVLLGLAVIVAPGARRVTRTSA